MAKTDPSSETQLIESRYTSLSLALKYASFSNLSFLMVSVSSHYRLTNIIVFSKNTTARENSVPLIFLGIFGIFSGNNWYFGVYLSEDKKKYAVNSTLVYSRDCHVKRIKNEVKAIPVCLMWSR